MSPIVVALLLDRAGSLPLDCDVEVTPLPEIAKAVKRLGTAVHEHPLGRSVRAWLAIYGRHGGTS